jgi:hypothetical protein
MRIHEIIKLRFLFFILSFFIFTNILKPQYSFLTKGFGIDSKISPSINKTKQKIFSLEKFSIGVFSGINFSQVIPLGRTSVFSAGNNDSFNKDYGPFYKNFGTQLGIILNYNINKIFTLGLHPLIIDYKYAYKNTYQWSGHTNLLYEAQIAHNLSFFELPLLLGIHTTFKKWQPYYQGGIYFGHLKTTHTDISVVETSPNLSGSDQSLNYSTSVNSVDQYTKNQYGLMAGAGIAYVGGGISVGIEANLRFLISNLNSIESRYSNNVIISGNYDIPDRFKFSNLAINLNIIVPLVCRNQNGKGGSLFCE